MIAHPTGNPLVRENATHLWPSTYTPPFNSAHSIEEPEPPQPPPFPPPPLAADPPPPHEIPLPSNSGPIRVFQNNVKKSSPITHAILNQYATSKDLLILQEPWTGPVGTGKSDSCADGTPIFGMPNQASWNAFHPVPITDDRSTNPRVAIYVNRSLKKYQVSIRSDLSSHRDLIALEIRSRKKSLLIINVYNDDHNSALDILYGMPLPGDVPTIITGDFNLHHPLWSVEDPVPRSTGRSSDLVDWMESKAFHLCNSQGEVTFQRPHKAHIQASVLDLTWINELGLSLGCLKDWSVSPDLHTSSDHLPLSWSSFLYSLPPLTNATDSPTFLYEDEKAVEWTTAFLKELSFRSPPQPTPMRDSVQGEDHNFRNLPQTGDAPATATTSRPHTLKTAARTPLEPAKLPDPLIKCGKQITDLMEAMTVASTSTLKRKEFHPQASPWFTEEVALMVAEVKKTRLTLKRSPELIQASISRHRAAARKLKRVIRKAKKDWAMAFAGQISSREVWRLTAWFKGIRRTGTPTLKDPSSGVEAVSLTEKRDMLSKSFFPPPPVLDGEDRFLEGPLDPRADTRPLEPLTMKEVETAMCSCANDTAPGVSGVPYRAVKWAWNSKARPLIFQAFSDCLKEDFHAPQWKSSITVVIPKPGKPSYSTPRAYRPIQLLECLGKIMEKIVASRLMYDISKLNLVPHEQFGGRKASSCTDAALSLTHDIQSGWKNGMVSTFLCIDVKGFFDNVNHGRMTRVLWEMGFPIEIVKWIRSFLSARSTAFRIDDVLHQVQDIDIGIPQGSPCSPVLSIIYAAEVISDIVEAQIITPCQTALSPRAYIDDLGLLAISKSLQDNISTLKLGLTRVIQKLSSIGMSIDPSKLEIQHFSRRPNDPSNPPLIMTLPSEDKLTSIIPTAYTRWLGFFLDKRLSFNKHVDIMCKRASSVINGLRCLGNTVRGLSQRHFRLLYVACVFPILTYGATVWYRPHKQVKTLVRKLEVVQNKAIRMITGAFKTTPIELIQLRSFLPPIEVWLKKLNQQAAIRLHKLPLLSPVIQRLPDIWRNRKKPTVETPFSTPPNFGLNAAKLTDLHSLAASTPSSAEKLEPFHSDNAPWSWDKSLALDHLSINHSTCLPGEIPGRVQSANILLQSLATKPDTVVGYCDGSRMRKAGYGIVLYHLGFTLFETSIGLGFNCTAFDGEIWALAHTLIKIRDFFTSGDLDDEIKHIRIYSDSTSALQSISDPSPHPGQLAALIWRKHFALFREEHPGCTLTLSWIPGHHGSIGNDRADSLAKFGTTRPALLLASISALKEKARKKVRYRWRKCLKSDTIPSTTPDSDFDNTPREIFGRITQILSGHGYIGEYYLNFVHSESPWCPCTDEVLNPTLQTRDHILYECPRYEAHRHLIDNRSTFSLANPKDGLQDFIKFLKATGAFTKMGLPLPDPPALPPKKKKPPDK